MNRLVLVGLAVTVSAGLVWVYVRRRRATSVAVPTPLPVAPTPPRVPSAAPRVLTAATATSGGEGALACPTCGRRYATDLRFCCDDGRTLIPAQELTAGSAPPAAACRICRRTFDAALRFCPFDSEPLSTSALPPATGAADDHEVCDKICPRCSERYRMGASFCGRDGDALVPVH